MIPVFIDSLSKLSKFCNTAIPNVFVATLCRFKLGRFNKHTNHSFIQAINKILNGTYEQPSNYSICPLHFTVNHWKLLSECGFQPDLGHDFSQGILALINVVWASVTLRYVISAAASLSTECHPLESEIRLSQLVLFMRDSCWQVLISLVSICLEIILVLLVFFFSWVLNLLVSSLFCWARRWLLVVPVVWKCKDFVDGCEDNSVGETLDQMWPSSNKAQRHKMFSAEWWKEYFNKKKLFYFSLRT